MIHTIMDVPTRKVHRDELEIHNLLGRGGEGTVNRGLLRGRIVAVKKTHGDPEALQREAITTKKCKSPYLLPLVAVVEEGDPALVLEIMDGGDLRKYLNNKRDGVPVAVEYSTFEVAWVIANAIADLHHAGLLHRDLKSKNVLLSSTHYIRVADQGIAKENATLNTLGVGTLQWMAPEVLKSESVYSYAADIYSFGVILTELDTYQMPFAGFSDVAILSKVQAGNQPTLRANCSPWLRDLATACMAFDPTQRPSANDVVHILQRQRHSESAFAIVALPASQGNSIDGQPAAVLNTVVACSVCNAPLSLQDTEGKICTKPALPDATRLNILLQRIEVSATAIDTMVSCATCRKPVSMVLEVCPFSDCGAPLFSASTKVHVLCRRIDLANKSTSAYFAKEIPLY
ncbi:protein kinase [Achlya hypogyna]|uniref:Protein kinase n=1 Tax=Achlya hypogyna TaxID=1202772 RepID=A0A1V9YUR6_ACHHY|nr:protein kinase [Achlya hypogyna]